MLNILASRHRRACRTIGWCHHAGFVSPTPTMPFVRVLDEHGLSLDSLSVAQGTRAMLAFFAESKHPAWRGGRRGSLVGSDWRHVRVSGGAANAST